MTKTKGLKASGETVEETMTKDPVCGMEIDEKKAAATAVYQGKTYYFCSANCKAAFSKAPEKYVKS